MAYTVGRRRFSYNKDVKIMRVVTKLLVVLIGLWVGGELVNILGTIVNGTASPFYKGFTLIGWTVTSTTNATNSVLRCGTDTSGAATGTAYTNCVTATNGAGILVVVGLIGIASIILEFVKMEKI